MKKNNLLHVIFTLLILFFCLEMEQAFARKVIAVDSDPNDNGFLSNGEGWARGTMRPGDTIIVGQPLDSTLKKLHNGDTLIIICHGWGVGLGFKWGGVRYRGFGTGDSLHPVPPGFDTLKNVHVVFVSCWSERDPDGPDTTDKPMTEKIKKAMGPPSNGNTATGFTNKAMAGNLVSYSYFPDQTDTATINNFLRTGNPSWQKCPPVNRVPPVIPNQQTCLQVLLDSLKGGPGRATVSGITYNPPVNGPNMLFDTCYCDCNSSEYCGCTFTIPIPVALCDNSASTWSPQTSGTINDLNSISAVSNQIAWAAGNGPAVLRTTNGGNSWTDATGSGINGDVYVIYAVDADTAFCSTAPSGTFIYKTTNGGSSWIIVFAQTGGFIDGIKMISPSTGYAVGDPVGGKWTVLKTTNSGNIWTRIATEPTQVGTDFGWNNSFKIIGSNIWFGTSGTKTYHSSNLGVTWTSAPTAGTINSYAVHFNSATLGLAGGETMNKTTNGGISYLPVSFPGGTGGAVSGISGSGSDWWAVKTDSLIYHSTNQGTTWTVAYNQPGSAFLTLDMTTVGGCLKGWTVGAGGDISVLGPGYVSILNLKALIQGFWNGSTNNNDTLTVQIRNSFPPFALIDVAKGKNDASGFVPLHYTGQQIINGTPYYIVVNHRNSIQTWSKAGGEIWTGVSLNYDFTVSSVQAFGNNQVLKGGKYCIYGADVNQDGIVDLTDLVLIYNDATSFASGYIITDVTGDNLVDLSDLVLVFNNSANFVSKITP